MKKISTLQDFKKIKEIYNTNDIDKIQRIIATTILHKKAKQTLKNLFEQIKEHDAEIKNSKYKQIIEEVNLEEKYIFEEAIVMEWGEKIKPTENEKKLLINRSKFNRFFSMLTLFIFNKDKPKKIIYSNYKFICFHFNSYQIVFPHNTEFSPINIENFIANPKIIYINIASALKTPNVNKKILNIGKDY